MDPMLPGDGRFPQDPEFEDVHPVVADGLEGVRVMARMQGTYLAALLAEGFERDEALDLVSQWMEMLINHELAEES